MRAAAEAAAVGLLEWHLDSVCLAVAADRLVELVVEADVESVAVVVAVVDLAEAAFLVGFGRDDVEAVEDVGELNLAAMIHRLIGSAVSEPSRLDHVVRVRIESVAAEVEFLVATVIHAYQHLDDPLAVAEDPPVQHTNHAVQTVDPASSEVLHTPSTLAQPDHLDSQTVHQASSGGVANPDPYPDTVRTEHPKRLHCSFGTAPFAAPGASPFRAPALESVAKPTDADTADTPASSCALCPAFAPSASDAGALAPRQSFAIYPGAPAGVRPMPPASP